jgi:hypothetical protein
MINRKQRISLGVASAAAVLLVVTLFLPWMGFTHGGDISKSSSEFVSGGGVLRPLTDQSAFALSGLLAAMVVLGAVAVLLVSLAASFSAGLIEVWTTGMVVIALGIGALAATAIFVFGINSDPLDFAGGASGPALLDWGALIGAKLATLASAVIVIAGAAFVASEPHQTVTSPEREPTSAV